MKLFVDENVERPIIDALVGAGHDVLLAVDTNPQAEDEALLAAATSSDRVLLTNDKDFAWLVFFARRGAHGVILLRLAHMASREKAARVVQVLSSTTEPFEGSIVVIEHDSLRRRLIPAG